MRPALFSASKLVKFEYLLSLLIILLAFAVRLHNLGGDSFWIDEILTTDVVDRGWDAFEGDHTHPGLFFLITTATYPSMGETEFAARISPMFFGVLSIPLIILAGKIIGRTSWGLWAALLLALSPFHVRYSQEARMYAQLMALTLISFILLYKALKQPGLKLWIAFVIATVLNLYTHYGALIVLASQSVLIAVWGLARLSKRDYRSLLFPAGAAPLIILLYLPWLPRFIDSLQYNVGADTITDTGTRASLGRWFRVGYIDFSMFDEQLAIVFVGLCLVGLLILALKRRWLALSWMVTGLVLPLLLIYIFQVARGATSRYVIYLLPFFLLPVAIAVDTALDRLKQLPGRAFYLSGVTGTLLIFVWIAYPRVQEEHRFIKEDWRGIIGYLDENADEGDVILSMTMNMNFNLVGAALPAYLEQAHDSYHFLKGNWIELEDLLELQEGQGGAWAVVHLWNNPQAFEDKSLSLAKFQSNLLVVHDTDAPDDPLQQSIYLYEQMLPFASSPVPECLLRKDLTLLYLANSDFNSAQRNLDQVKKLCPLEGVSESERAEITDQINLGKVVKELDLVANDGDIVIGHTLSVTGTNKLESGKLSYFLERSKNSYQYLGRGQNQSNGISLPAIDLSDVWLIIWSPLLDLDSFDNDEIQVNHIFNYFYIISSVDNTVPPLDQLTNIYGNFVGEPTVQCAVMTNIIEIYAASGLYEEANRKLEQLSSDCLDLSLDSPRSDIVAKNLHLGLQDLFTKSIEAWDPNISRHIATMLIRFAPKHPEALALLTENNLLARFEQGESTVSLNGSPEPVEKRRFIMPHNGDWGDVIFTHPPAAVSFDLELPEEPVALRTRIALDPQSWGWGGDGVTFVITVQEGTVPPDEVYRYHLSNEESGHDWHNVLVSLAAYAGKQIELTLATETGPNHDGTGDWAGWDTPLISRES